MNLVSQGTTTSPTALAKLVGWLSNGPAHLFIKFTALVDELRRGELVAARPSIAPNGVAPTSNDGETGCDEPFFKTTPCTEHN